jgi:hypothetical protein
LADDLGLPPPSASEESEIDEVRKLVKRRTAADIERILWWDAGGPAYRWNEIAIAAMLEEFFVTSLPASRNLALLHVAIDDAVMVASAAKQEMKRPRPSVVDPSTETALPVPTAVLAFNNVVTLAPSRRGISPFLAHHV